MLSLFLGFMSGVLNVWFMNYLFISYNIDEMHPYFLSIALTSCLAFVVSVTIGVVIGVYYDKKLGLSHAIL